MTEWAPRAWVLASSLGALAVTLPARPPRLVLAVVVTAAAVSVGAAVTRWMLAGTLSTVAVAVAVVVTELGDHGGGLRPLRLTVAAALLLSLVAALDRLEQDLDPAAEPATLTSAPWWWRLALPGLGVAVTGALAALAGSDALTPQASVPAVLGAVAALAGAALLAGRTHRGGP